MDFQSVPTPQAPRSRTAAAAVSRNDFEEQKIQDNCTLGGHGAPCFRLGVRVIMTDDSTAQVLHA